MQRKFTILILVSAILISINHVFAAVAVNRETPVRVIEIKDLGLSEADETKTLIEIRWEINPAIHANHSAFNVTLDITYADGANLIFDEQAESSARFIRIEIPSLHVFRGKKSAIVKEIKAFVSKESK
jgi:hypothetical protein